MQGLIKAGLRSANVHLGFNSLNIQSFNIRMESRAAKNSQPSAYPLIAFILSDSTREGTSCLKIYRKSILPPALSWC